MNWMILMSAERALASVVSAVGVQGLQVYRGVYRLPEMIETNEPPNQKLPRSVCTANSAQWETHRENNWIVAATVSVEAHAHDKDDEAFQAMVSSVFEALHEPDLADKLTAAVENFTCHNAKPEMMDLQVGGGKWVARFNLELDCTPTDAE